MLDIRQRFYEEIEVTDANRAAIMAKFGQRRVRLLCHSTYHPNRMEHHSVTDLPVRYGLNTFDTGAYEGSAILATFQGVNPAVRESFVRDYLTDSRVTLQQFAANLPHARLNTILVYQGDS